MSKYLLAILVIISSIGSIYSQSHSPVYKVFYYNLKDGEIDPNSEYIMKYVDGICYLSEEDAKIRNYIDFGNSRNVSILGYDGKLYMNSTDFDSLPVPEYREETDEIMGYGCNLATYNVFSNKIDVWYCDTTSFRGSPYSRYLPNEQAIALKIVINGNRIFMADSIVVSQEESKLSFPYNDAKVLSDSEFEELKIRSRYSTIKVFENDTVNFDPDYWKMNSYNANTEVFHYSKGAVILKKIKVPELIKKGGYVFARLKCSSAGDAYDRTGSAFIIPVNDELSMVDAFKEGLDKMPVFIDNTGREYQGNMKTDNYSPPIEIMRFFTSFGAGHFNDKRVINNYPWEAEAFYKSEITSMFPTNYDEVWIGVFIGNYDRGGHRVSLELDIYPAWGEENIINRNVLSLFNTVNIMEMSGQEYGRIFKNDTLEVSFTIPDSLENVELIYTTTGHGGWGGGDEFNPKQNQVLLDGEPLFSIIPWRTDCATYRFLNPASGNFGNGLSSSDLSRSNWCPGTLTPPYIIQLDNIEKGDHTMKIIIDQGDDSGGSFNHWSISGIISGTVKE